MKSITECLTYLSETDDYYGLAAGNVKALEHRLKVIEAIEFLKCETGSVEHRRAAARTSEDYLKKSQEYENAILDRETISAKRKTCELTIEVWRTQQANKRQGNIQ